MLHSCWALVAFVAAALSQPRHAAAAIRDPQQHELNNGLVRALVSSDGSLASVTDLRRTPPVTHTLPAPADGADWAVSLSDYNATSNPSTLSRTSGCTAAPQSNTTLLPAHASFTFACGGGWSLVVEYTLATGATAVTKGISLGKSSGQPWAGTIRSVSLMRGAALGDAYTGMLAKQATVAQFHPSHAKPGQVTKYPYVYPRTRRARTPRAHTAHTRTVHQSMRPASVDDV